MQAKLEGVGVGGSVGVGSSVGVGVGVGKQTVSAQLSAFTLLINLGGLATALEPKILLKCPYIFKGANHNEVLDVLNTYFNCKFKLDWIWSWWSFPSEKPIGPQL